MKKDLKLFILKNCPYCKEALKFMKALKDENPKYANIEFKLIEEKEEPILASQYDYYYVPTFYSENTKLHEGGVTKEKVASIFDICLEE